MAESLRKVTSHFCRDEKGVTLVEYGIALIMAISLGSAGLIGLGGNVETNIKAACDVLDPTCVP